MSGHILVTDADLARARSDPAFRHQLVTENLERLLGEINRLRSAGPDVARTHQIREGVGLAVQLAELLQRMSGARADLNRAAS